MYSDREIIRLVHFAKDHIQDRLDSSLCKGKCDAHEECRTVASGALSREVKLTYRPKLLRKILLTHYNGLQVNTTQPGLSKKYSLSGRTLKFAMRIEGIGGNIERGDNADDLDGICEGEYEPNSFIRHQTMFCRTAEDFYGSLAQFINKWE